MKALTMMDPLLTVQPMTTSLPSSVVNGGCKLSGPTSAMLTQDDPIKPEENLLVNYAEIKEVLEYFVKATYRARDAHPKANLIMEKCTRLFGIDYNYSILANAVGELSSNYPGTLIILESEREPSPLCSPKYSVRSQYNGSTQPYSYSMSPGSGLKPGTSSNWRLNHNPSSLLTSGQHENGELPRLKDLCGRARFARCRARFPVSVILYNYKHICRSATLSGGPEIYGRSSFDYLFSGGGVDLDPIGDDDDIISEAQNQSDWQLFDRVRSQDIRLLRAFQVQTIFDLMVEKKKVKFGVNVTSSEKVDKENRYAEFNIVSLPYPGCEFFKNYRDNGYCAEKLVFEWNQGHMDADICVPSNPTAASLNIDWSHYREWDLVVLSQNYLKLLLGYLRDRDSGLLIHCISGWDRTPLFISLVRMSLWADGEIHKSLDADQILYLTLSYDWLLFGHNLEDRLSKGEEILYFCFNFLKYIVGPEFNINYTRREIPKTTHLSKVRNDSDVHLEGVLLDNEGSHTSPEGSNWSLNSASSTQSTKSLETPPSCFQVSAESWEECHNAQPMVHHSNSQAQDGFTNSLVHNLSQPMFCANTTTTGSCDITASMMNSVVDLPSSATPTPSTGISVGSPILSTNRPTISPIVIVPLPIPTKTDSAISDLSGIKAVIDSNSVHGRAKQRTSQPVAVPSSSSLNLYHHPRHESNSSASIGSWQLVHGTGSLKETFFSSVPGSYSSFSHPSRLSANLECIESSESSCTLVEDVRFIEPKTTSLELPLTPKCDQFGFETTSVGLFEEELGLALEENLIIGTDNCRERVHPPPDSLGLMSSVGEEEAVTATTTPTRNDCEGCDVTDGCVAACKTQKFTKNEESTLQKESATNISIRQERLDKIRHRFRDIYEGTVRSTAPVNENSSGSSGGGLGFLIGNIATKVGIRSSSHRTSNS